MKDNIVNLPKKGKNGVEVTKKKGSAHAHSLLKTSWDVNNFIYRGYLYTLRHIIRVHERENIFKLHLKLLKFAGERTDRAWAQYEDSERAEHFDR